jgi:hypothetical protein
MQGRVESRQQVSRQHASRTSGQKECRCLVLHSALVKSLVKTKAALDYATFDIPGLPEALHVVFFVFVKMVDVGVRVLVIMQVCADSRSLCTCARIAML